jgi:sugar porter (SP) family MFS transporter
MLVPLYQSEVAPKQIRGALISIYQLAITIGIFFSFIINYYTKDIDSDMAFQIPLGLQAVFGGILFVGMVMMPFSPRWLVQKGRHSEAETWLSKLRSASAKDLEVQSELDSIRMGVEDEKRQGRSTYGDLLRGSLFKRVALGVIMQAFQQLTGINFIFYYGVSFFRSAGLSNEYLFQAITGLVNVMATFPAIYLIERLGRRKLLLGGATLMVCNALLSQSTATN